MAGVKNCEIKFRERESVKKRKLLVVEEERKRGFRN